jgi:hypothetical protein
VGSGQCVVRDASAGALPTLHIPFTHHESAWEPKML